LGVESWGLGIWGVYDLGFHLLVWGLGLRVYGLGFRVKGLLVRGLRVRVACLSGMLRAPGFWDLKPLTKP
jgi:hypothetical protein